MFLILQSCKVESRAQIPVIRLFDSLKAKLTAIIDRGQARKAKHERVKRVEVLLVPQLAGDARHIVIIDKVIHRRQMRVHAALSKLPVETVGELKKKLLSFKEE